MRAASVAIGSFVIAHAFIVVIVIIFHCQPIARFWDPSIPGTCIDELAWARYVSVPNILSDAALMVLPLPSIWKIQISWQQRLGLSTIFILGGLYVLHHCSISKNEHLGKGLDCKLTHYTATSSLVLSG